MPDSTKLLFLLMLCGLVSAQLSESYEHYWWYEGSLSPSCVRLLSHTHLRKINLGDGAGMKDAESAILLVKRARERALIKDPLLGGEIVDLSEGNILTIMDETSLRIGITSSGGGLLTYLFWIKVRNAACSSLDDSIDALQLSCSAVNNAREEAKKAVEALRYAGACDEDYMGVAKQGCVKLTMELEGERWREVLNLTNMIGARLKERKEDFGEEYAYPRALEMLIGEDSLIHVFEEIKGSAKKLLEEMERERRGLRMKVKEDVSRSRRRLSEMRKMCEGMDDERIVLLLGERELKGEKYAHSPEKKVDEAAHLLNGFPDKGAEELLVESDVIYRVKGRGYLAKSILSLERAMEKIEDMGKLLNEVEEDVEMLVKDGKERFLEREGRVKKIMSEINASQEAGRRLLIRVGEKVDESWDLFRKGDVESLVKAILKLKEAEAILSRGDLEEERERALLAIQSLNHSINIAEEDGVNVTFYKEFIESSVRSVHHMDFDQLEEIKSACYMLEEEVKRREMGILSDLKRERDRLIQDMNMGEIIGYLPGEVKDEFDEMEDMFDSPFGNMSRIRELMKRIKKRIGGLKEREAKRILRNVRCRLIFRGIPEFGEKEEVRVEVDFPAVGFFNESVEVEVECPELRYVDGAIVVKGVGEVDGDRLKARVRGGEEVIVEGMMEVGDFRIIEDEVLSVNQEKLIKEMIVEVRRKGPYEGMLRLRKDVEECRAFSDRGRVDCRVEEGEILLRIGRNVDGRIRVVYEIGKPYDVEWRRSFEERGNKSVMKTYVSVSSNVDEKIMVKVKVPFLCHGNFSVDGAEGRLREDYAEASLELPGRDGVDLILTCESENYTKCVERLRAELMGIADEGALEELGVINSTREACIQLMRMKDEIIDRMKYEEERRMEKEVFEDMKAKVEGRINMMRRLRAKLREFGERMGSDEAREHLWKAEELFDGGEEWRDEMRKAEMSIGEDSLEVILWKLRDDFEKKVLALRKRGERLRLEGYDMKSLADSMFVERMGERDYEGAMEELNAVKRWIEEEEERQEDFLKEKLREVEESAETFRRKKKEFDEIRGRWAMAFGQENRSIDGLREFRRFYEELEKCENKTEFLLKKAGELGRVEGFINEIEMSMERMREDVEEREGAAVESVRMAELSYEQLAEVVRESPEWERELKELKEKIMEMKEYFEEGRYGDSILISQEIQERASRLLNRAREKDEGGWDLNPFSWLSAEFFVLVLIIIMVIGATSLKKERKKRKLRRVGSSEGLEEVEVVSFE